MCSEKRRRDPMNELNASQKAIAEKLDGMIVVDAGPGTGKTQTIIERYVNILRRPDVDPRDVLLLTFTNNAAMEMEDRIKNRLAGIEELKPKMKSVETSTFDAFCLAVVMDAPEHVSEFFGIDDRLTRNSRMYTNETLNLDYFGRMYDQFIADRYGDYGQAAVVAAGGHDDIYRMIGKLMARGVLPLRKGWFGGNDGDDLYGLRRPLLDTLRSKNIPPMSNRIPESELMNGFKKIFNKNPKSMDIPFDTSEPSIPDGFLEEAVMDLRPEIMSLVHDVYFEYIRRSVADNRLTFNLTAAFALAILIRSAETRKRMSYRYLMIDEFQDTNSNQMMISLMLLKEPNLCVVGDWKQGIYGFRYASVENITDFERRCTGFRRFLNDIDGIERVAFRIPEVERLPLDINYRSSQAIVDKAFDILRCPATKDEKLDHGHLDRNITLLTANRGDIDGFTGIEYFSAGSRNDEIDAVLCKADDYVNSGRYTVRENGEDRRPVYSDIAVLCKNNRMCREIRDRAEEIGLPAFLQGDVDVMSTREGKLVLAWLRYVNNEYDMTGIAAIMADAGYSLVDMKDVKDGLRSRPVKDRVPMELSGQRRKLASKQRRITELITAIFEWYGLNNDVTQCIITTLSSVHRDSLLTLSDLIRLIEEDIRSGTAYNVDAMLDRDALTIQTMHKSKGLEYPIVIIAGIDSRVLPYSIADNSDIMFSETLGVRSKKEVAVINGYSKIVQSWKYCLVKGEEKTDYDEQRRLMFVALSRAKQYITLISGNSPSKFMKHLAGTDDIPMADIRSPDAIGLEHAELNDPPAIPEILPRKPNMGVHDILDFDNAKMESDEVCGKGMEYGEKVHEAAQRIAEGNDSGEGYPELEYVRTVIAGLKGAEVSAEVPCTLPVGEPPVILRGIIDLLAVYPDRVEVHDWKTDAEDRFEAEYKVQLSVYAHAAEAFFKKPVGCFIDYVGMGRTVAFEPVPIGVVEERVRRRLADEVGKGTI
jgi:ATP-dependent helicase/nuclease subunit A